MPLLGTIAAGMHKGRLRCLHSPRTPDIHAIIWEGNEPIVVRQSSRPGQNPDAVKDAVKDAENDVWPLSRTISAGNLTLLLETKMR